MAGPPVVIVLSGGLPVTAVDSGAPLMTAVDSGGVPVTLTANGMPFVIEGLVPNPPGWQNGIFVAGNNAFGWGFAIPPLVSAPLGTLIEEPYTGGDLIAFFEAPDDSQIIVCFVGDVVSELTGYTFNINGAVLDVLTPPAYSVENNWTLMFLEAHWMIDGQAYIIHRVPSI